MHAVRGVGDISAHALSVTLDLLWQQAIVFGAVVVYGSFFEWAMHRYVMHRRTFPTFPFELHALLHHRIFKWDESFHALDEEMRKHVTFVPRDYLILVAIHAPLFVLFEWMTGLTIGLGAGLAVLAYLAMFDFVHWSFHVPGGRWYERIGMFRWLKRHHLLHHKYQDRNLNVVLPIADLVFRTLVTRPRPGASVLEV